VVRVIGDVTLARALQAEYNHLRSARPLDWMLRMGHPELRTPAERTLEARISRVLGELLVVEERLRCEGLAVTSEGELVSLETGMRVAA
jgi:hypothetical protein